MADKKARAAGRVLSSNCGRHLALSDKRITALLERETLLTQVMAKNRHFEPAASR